MTTAFKDDYGILKLMGPSQNFHSKAHQFVYSRKLNNDDLMQLSYSCFWIEPYDLLYQLIWQAEILSWT
jgi:hypothetical protein